MAIDPTSILVASADNALVDSIKASLHQNGFRVVSSWDDAPEADQPGVIVLDTSLPAHVSKELQTLRTPIVALSTPEGLQQAARTEGVWVCLTKPLELDNLILAVDRISKYTGS